MDGIKLKPCPFCGGEAAMIANGACIDATRGEYRAWEFCVMCISCNVSLPRRDYHLSVKLGKCGEIVVMQDERKEAADLWNRRADDAV